MKSSLNYSTVQTLQMCVNFEGVCVCFTDKSTFLLGGRGGLCGFWYQLKFELGLLLKSNPAGAKAQLLKNASSLILYMPSKTNSRFGSRLKA